MKSQIKDILQLIRPFQWVKNLFVFTGVIFGVVEHSFIYVQALLAAIAFCFVSSCVYIINDIVDREQDRHHPKKKNRPLAAGTVSVQTAGVVAGILFLAAMIVGYLSSPKVLVIIFLYIALNLAYSFKLKHIVILDVFCIAAGFMLRILAGTVGIGIPPSRWLLLCGMMITLFLGFAKRRAELFALSSKKEDHRQVLENYGPILLDEMIAITGAGTILSYSLYTMSPETILFQETEDLIYTVPFVVYGLFRYIYLIHHCSGGGEPSKELVKDPHIVLAVMAWGLLTIYLVM